MFVTISFLSVSNSKNNSLILTERDTVYAWLLRINSSPGDASQVIRWLAVLLSIPHMHDANRRMQTHFQREAKE